MKIRNGFVSNSSSSSFVVAFPHKPKDVGDVKKMMFGDREGNIAPFDYGVDYWVVAKIVFRDVKHQKMASLKKISELFDNRYYYSEYSGFYYKDDCYFGTNKNLLNKLKQLYIEEHKTLEEVGKEMKDLLDKNIPRVKYASKTSRGSEKEISDYEIYCDKVDKFTKENKEYKDLQAKKLSIWQESNKKTVEIRKELSKLDAEKFKEDNKKSFIAIFEYSDNDGDLPTAMEHGEIFNNLKNVRINNH